MKTIRIEVPEFESSGSGQADWHNKIASRAVREAHNLTTWPGVLGVSSELGSGVLRVQVEDVDAEGVLEMLAEARASARTEFRFVLENPVAA